MYATLIGSDVQYFKRTQKTYYDTHHSDMC